MKISVSRRGLLTKGSLLAAAGLAGGASAARAFSLEEPAAQLIDEYHAARAAACGDSGSYHQQVLADVRALLQGRDLPVEDKQRIEAQATCPLCGCPVAS